MLSEGGFGSNPPVRDFGTGPFLMSRPPLLFKEYPRLSAARPITGRNFGIGSTPALEV
jgi:hypothetical protein